MIVAWPEPIRAESAIVADVSWNASLLFIGATPDQTSELVTLGAATCDEPAVSEQVDTAWAHHVDGHGLVIVTTGVLDPDAIESLATSSRRTIVQAVLGGVADVFEFRVYQDGAEARELVQAEGETVQESGSPVPAESSAEVTDEEFAEDRFLALFAVASGLDDLGFLDEGEFTVVEQPRLLVAME